MERTCQGDFIVSMNKLGVKWTEAEQSQIEQFRENLNYEVERDWR